MRTDISNAVRIPGYERPQAVSVDLIPCTLQPFISQTVIVYSLFYVGPLFAEYHKASSFLNLRDYKYSHFMHLKAEKKSHG